LQLRLSQESVELLGQERFQNWKYGRFAGVKREWGAVKKACAFGEWNLMRAEIRLPSAILLVALT
jgi:hypothetical protein